MKFLKSLKSHALLIVMLIAAIAGLSMRTLSEHNQISGRGDGALSLVGVKAPSVAPHTAPEGATPAHSGLGWLGFMTLATGVLLTAPFDAPQRSGEFVDIPVEANTTLYSGGIIARNAAGNAVPANDAAALRVVGRCEDGVSNVAAAWNNNTLGAAGATFVRVRRGIFGYTNSSADPLTGADVGNICFIESDSVVNRSGGNNKIIAGRLIDIDATTGAAWVEFRDHAVAVN